jgi:RND superfamily putative drug exporter
MTIGRAVVRHRLLVVLVWLLACAALLPMAGRIEENLDAAIRIPGSESAAVEEALAGRFESPFAKTAILVVSGVPAPDTAAGDAALREVADALVSVQGVTRPFSYLDGHDPDFVGVDGRGTFVVVGLEGVGPRADILVPRLRAATGKVAAHLQTRFPDASVKWTGEAPLNLDFRRASADEARRAERRALPMTLVLLLLAFGALAAVTLAVVAGTLAIVLALGASALLATAYPLAVTLESVVSMLGLGLGIDYALLTISRFREALGSGCSPDEAAVLAAHHAGRTVALSGAAVAIGFFGLLLVPLEELRSVAVGGLITVAVCVLLATTLLPALLSLLGSRIDAGALGFLSTRRASGDSWRRWGIWVAAHPILVLLLAGAPVVALALEARRLNAELPRGDWLPSAMESARAVHDLEAMGRSGIVQEVRVVLEFPDDTSAVEAEGWAATKRLGERMAADPRVARVRSLRSFAGERGDDLAYISLMPGFLKHSYLSTEGDAAFLEVIPREGVEPRDLSRFVRELRRADAFALTGLKASRLRVGGLPGFNADYEDAVTGRLGAVFGLVVAGTFLALLFGFRSVLIPLKAVALNLLSVAGAFGAVVLVFQDGHGARWLGLTGAAGGVFPAVPVLVFSIVFGLSMDYEVFLVARVAEARRAGLSDSEALGEALARTAGVITSAAAIMVAVFGAFARGDFLLVQMLGFALAVAVLIDATLIRIAIGPALLRLSGRWNWWPGSPEGARPHLPTLASLPDEGR